MDNFELNTFSIESCIDWDKLMESEALPSSQASQQSDYLRNLDLGLDISEFDFLQNDEGCREGVKDEPELTGEDVLDQFLYPAGSEGTVQQLSPGLTLQQQFPASEPAGETVKREIYKAEPTKAEPTVVAVLPEIIHEIPDDIHSICSSDTDDAVPSPLDDFEDDLMSNHADSTTLDKELIYTVVNVSSHRTRVSNRERPPSPLFTDDFLRRVGTKEFNKHIQELSISSEEVKKWKRRRRTLKNRGYAQNCRQRRVGRHQAADEENMQLRRELAEERSRSTRLRQRIVVLESSLSAIRAKSNNV